MKIKKYIFVGIWFLSVVPFMALIAQDTQNLLNSAIYEEEVNGDLDEAISIYLEIVNQYPLERKQAAEALYRLGKISEKLEPASAIPYYEKLLQNYPKQDKFIQYARERLGDLKSNPRLSQETGGGTVSSPNKYLSISKIYTFPNFYGTSSRDGRYFSLSNWENGELQIYDRESETMNQLDGGSDNYKNGFCDRSLWSPGGSEIAYCFSHGNGNTELRLLDWKTNSFRPITPVQKNKMLWPEEWSMTGDRILASLWDRAAKKMWMVLVSPDDGKIDSIKLIKRGTGCQGNCWSISPDGEYVIYGYKVGPGHFDLHLIAVDSTMDKPLLSDAANKKIASWLPDQSGFLYYSDIGGQNALWLAHFDKAYKIKSTEVLVDGVSKDATTVGMAESGDFTFFQSNRIGELYNLDFDQESHTLSSRVRVETESSYARFGPQISPDGKQIVYFSSPPLDPDDIGLTLKNIHTGAEERLVLDEIFPGGAFSIESGIKWSPDGENVLITYWQSGNHLAKLDLRSKNVVWNIKGNFPKVYSDNGDLYYVKIDKTGDYILSQSEGQKTMDTLYAVTTPNIRRLSISPDGNYLAFYEYMKGKPRTDYRLNVLEIKTKKLSTIWEIENGYTFFEEADINWLTDNKTLLVAVEEIENELQQLYFVDYFSGERNKLGNPIEGTPNYFRSIDVVPNENKIIYGIKQDWKNVWEISGY